MQQPKGETIRPFSVSINEDSFDNGLYGNIGETGLKIQYVMKEKSHVREHGKFGY